jgi:ATP-dependent Clp protease adapter protein ClpS|tara:strand:- start:481 stop:600 length:120 start_codon:yes stop_codon:yes gene_type:complete
MLETHKKGKAVVINCPLEHAEPYLYRIRFFVLATTIEKG